MSRLSTGSTDTQSSEDSQNPRQSQSYLSHMVTPGYRRLQRQIIAKRPSMVRLDPRLRVTSKNRDVPTLHFGLAFNKAQIMEFAKRHDLLDPDDKGDSPDDEACRFGTAIFDAQEYFRVHHRIQVFIERPILPEHGYMFALYSNHSRRKLALVKPAEKRVLDIIRAELGLGEQRALWYWDAQHGPRYRSGIPEFDL
ncbi:hypothetical protein PENSPDRAFT_277263 [Peniophora sp. CONT]|nr:hypothetical protein PENSPDRAFT_277263 [Peniophora sp. CONT]